VINNNTGIYASKAQCGMSKILCDLADYFFIDRQKKVIFLLLLKFCRQNFQNFLSHRVVAQKNLKNGFATLL